MENRKEKVIDLIHEYVDATEGGGYLTDPDTLYKELSILMAKTGVLADVISRFLFDQSDDLKMQCNEISISVDPCYKDDKYVDLVIYDDQWKELKRIKTLNGL